MHLAFKYAISNIKGKPEVLLVNIYGSILDEFEFGKENFVELLKEIYNFSEKSI